MLFEDIAMGDKVTFVQRNIEQYGRVVTNLGDRLILSVCGVPAIITEDEYVEHLPAREAH